QGEIVYERYYGVQQKSTGVPVSERSYFRCASVTKLVTGIGLMKMMDEGLLDPDEDIGAYLGYTVRNPRYMDTPITLRMLMSHTSGINESSSYTKRSSLLSDMLDVTRKAKSNFRDVRPGATYTYSNFGAGVTGAIIEAVTGEDVSTYMRRSLFEPLGIDAAYTVTQLADQEDITATYHKDGSLYQSPAYMLRQPYSAAADPDTHYRTTIGSLLIRPRDLARLGIALAGDGTVDGVRVLSEEAVLAMRQEQSEETTGITSDSPYTFFTIRQDTLIEGKRVYGHQGTDEGIVCNLYVEPESETVFVVMTNGCNSTRDDGIMRITRRLVALALEEIPQ
ncbi:MAG: serine hydrolase domain-containing protein, partial [Clostridia bacterium]|nr:serine hydrolase domain-containing protein [Clostridia bacterium]